MIYTHQNPFSLFFCSPNPILGARMYLMHFSFQTCFLNQLKDIHGTQPNDGKKSNLLLMKISGDMTLAHSQMDLVISP